MLCYVIRHNITSCSAIICHTILHYVMFTIKYHTATKQHLITYDAIVYYTISYGIIFHSVIPCDMILCNTISYYFGYIIMSIIMYYLILNHSVHRLTVLQYAMAYNIMLYYIMLCYLLLHYAILCYETIYYTTLSYAIRYYTMLCSIILYPCYSMVYYNNVFLHYTTWYVTMQCCIKLYHIISYHIMPSYVMQCCICRVCCNVSNYTILYCTMLQYTTL